MPSISHISKILPFSLFAHSRAVFFRSQSLHRIWHIHLSRLVLCMNRFYKLAPRCYIFQQGTHLIPFSFVLQLPWKPEPFSHSDPTSSGPHTHFQRPPKPLSAARIVFLFHLFGIYSLTYSCDHHIFIVVLRSMVGDAGPGSPRDAAPVYLPCFSKSFIQVTRTSRGPYSF